MPFYFVPILGPSMFVNGRLMILHNNNGTTHCLDWRYIGPSYVLSLTITPTNQRPRAIVPHMRIHKKKQHRHRRHLNWKQLFCRRDTSFIDRDTTPSKYNQTKCNIVLLYVVLRTAAGRYCLSSHWSYRKWECAHHAKRENFLHGHLRRRNLFTFARSLMRLLAEGDDALPMHLGH